MSVAVATLGCTRKLNDLHSWDVLASQLQGDYKLYINYEVQQAYAGQASRDEENTTLIQMRDKFEKYVGVYFDIWSWSSMLGFPSWRNSPKFDQDQARLASIVCARNMAIEFAMQTDASHLLFIDADIVPPLDIIPKLLEVEEDAVCGMVYGRGAHAHCPYIFGEKQRYQKNGINLIEVEHANIGYTMLSRRLFNQIRFRYGLTEYPDGRHQMVSDDPAYHLDAFVKFGKWPVIRQDVVGRHIGDLLPDQTSQY